MRRNRGFRRHRPARLTIPPDTHPVPQLREAPSSPPTDLASESDEPTVIPPTPSRRRVSRRRFRPRETQEEVPLTPPPQPQQRPATPEVHLDADETLPPSPILRAHAPPGPVQMHGVNPFTFEPIETLTREQIESYSVYKFDRDYRRHLSAALVGRRFVETVLAHDRQDGRVMLLVKYRYFGQPEWTPADEVPQVPVVRAYMRFVQ